MGEHDGIHAEQQGLGPNEAVSYGGTDNIKSRSPVKRRRMNAVGIFLSIMVPWLVYCAVFAARCFSIRYKKPSESNGICFLCFAVVLICCGLAYSQIQKRRSGSPGYEPMWYIFLAFTTALAWMLGYGSGEYNYKTNMTFYFEYMHLNEYWYVDPARMRGAQMMDAGTVQFVNNTFLQTRYSMGFRNDGVYCVAPITSVNAPLASYDFWAVGMNCCTGSSNDFACAQGVNGDINATHSGLRLLTDSSRAYYRLAVQQAEATYGIRSEHPLFFHWVGDPAAEKAAAYQAGWATYLIGMFAYFFFQCFLVIMASIFFAKINPY